MKKFMDVVFFIPGIIVGLLTLVIRMLLILLLYVDLAIVSIGDWIVNSYYNIVGIDHDNPKGISNFAKRSIHIITDNVYENV